MVHAAERHRNDRSGWLRAAVLGANDGIVSTASLVLGVIAAGAEHRVVLLTSISGLIAGAMSMAAGEFVSVHTQADTEQTLDELRARVRSVVDYLGALVEQDFATVGERTVTQPRWNGKIMSASDYFMEHVLPNFYFHLTHTYAILRHNGVPLGKRDYLGTLSQREP